MKIKKMLITLLLSIVICLANFIPSSAAVPLPSVSSSKPIACYTLQSSGRVYAYTAANLRNKTGGYIDCATDECNILRISGNAVQVEYPVPSGTRTAWFARSAFSSYNMANGAAKRWTQNRQVTTYRRADGKTSYGYISAGDTCYKLSESAGYIQAVYPVSGSYKMGWITKDSFEDSASSPNSSGQNNSSQLVPNGLYKVVSMIDKQYVWDIYDASTDNGGNLQLWKDNGTNAQKFMFTYNSDGYYTITNANSNKAIDCAGGKSADGTNIQQYTSNHTNAQKWKVTSAGNGYYAFQCKGNGKMIDVSGGTVSDGKNIQLYRSNGSKAQKFALVKTQKKQEASNNTKTSGNESAGVKQKAQEIAKYALSQVGIGDSHGNNNVVYNTWFYGHRVSGSGYAWCQAFVSYCGNHIGVLGTAIPKTASCQSAVSYYKDRDLFRNSRHYGGSYTPKIGDIVYYTENGRSSNHVGIIVGAPVNGYLQVVEGNVLSRGGDYKVTKFTSNSKRKVTSSYVLGYATPNY